MKIGIITISIVLILGVTVYFYTRPDHTYEDGAVAYKKGDYKKAMELLSISADRGNSTAIVTVGEMYALGFGVEKDKLKAKSYFQKADKQEALWMIRAISKRYLDGDGVKKDKDEAAYWGSIYNQFEKEKNN